ncbi:hypothetical protein MLD38_021173 [Melastoma candidum]|uniref:Uncharacterized protein n=1 Tax=Melastoma candidum TaxID=119954 RepID=A0ACB9QFI3_9MYRT|nr:hypothetical protein MLD38_021173 [Melastoma candidum]
MVAGKVKQAMRFHKSPKPPQQQQQPPSTTSSSSSHVQPKPPDIFEVLRLVDHLRDRESHLLTQLLQLKLSHESSSLDAASKNAQLSALSARLHDLGRENDRLCKELAELKLGAEAAREDSDRTITQLRAEIYEIKKSSDSESSGGDGGVASSQRFRLQQNAEASAVVEKWMGPTGAWFGVKKAVAGAGVRSNEVAENQLIERSETRPEEEVGEIKRSRHCRYNSEEMAESGRLRGPRVPKPPPLKKSSSLPPSAENSPPEKAAAPPPPPPLPPPATTNWRSKTEPVPTTAAAPPPPPPPSPLPPQYSAPPMARTVPLPPPPPPPAPRGGSTAIMTVRRIPEVVEFYHSLMRRDTRRDASNGGPTTAPDSASAVAAFTSARDMIGEIENRSAHLLAIKTDVETQGDLIRFLIKEVEGAAFSEIEDVVPFVKWLDDELSYLVDERAVLKHFDWPEQKADALREAAFGYCDVKKLESEASSFHDVSRQPCSQALKKMQTLLEKLEHGVYNLSRMRESAANRYKVFQIPTDWMLDNGIICQIKLASVKLAMQYMKRVSAELELAGGGPEEEELIVQGVRFAFRVHQFAGGFDMETMKAFQELREKARSCHVQCQNQQQG